MDTLKKLGAKPGITAVGIAVPDSLKAELGLENPGKSKSKPGVIVAFVTSAAEVAKRAPEAVSLYERGAALWFAYPKKTGKIMTDISRDSGWEPLGKAGLLPVTVVSLDDTWSAKRYRYRDEIKKLTRYTS